MSAEAQIANFNFEFRKNDPDKRLRVQAIIEQTVNEAKQKISKKTFAYHLQNSKKDIKDVTDSRKMR